LTVQSSPHPDTTHGATAATGRRKHVLLLGMQFPPARGSGVYRLRAWANHLVKQGYDVTVLCADRDYWLQLTGSLDDDLAARTDPRVRLIEVKIPREHLIQDVRQMSWLHASFPKAFLEMHRLLQAKFFPEVYAPLIPVYLAAALKVHTRHRIDLVLASGNPYSMFAVAWILGKVLRKPYVVDYHDPWTLNVLTEEDVFEPGHAAFKWERRIVEGAARVVTVNNALCDWYRERYPKVADRVRLVPLGLAEDIVTAPTFSPVSDDRPLRFGFLGTVRHDLPIEEFLEGWLIALKAPVMRDATMEFYGYLGFFARHEEQIGRRILDGITTGVSYKGPVSQTKIPEVFGGLDALAMLLPSSKYMTGGKGFDYMAAGRPVVGVHDPRNDTSALFANYPLFFGVSKVEPNAIAEAIVAAGTAARSETFEQFKACRAEALEHTWDIAMAPMAREFGEIIDG